jgi:hypothetical protein
LPGKDIPVSKVETVYYDEQQGGKVPIENILRRIPENASAIIESSGSVYSTNIGKQVHEAAGLIEKLKEELRQPVNADVPAVQHLLSRDQRDALCAANAFLTLLQSKVGDESMTAHRIQKSINVISDMLYGDK